MVQFKHFTEPQKMPNFQFSRLAAGQNTRRPQRGQKSIVNQSKPILVIVSMKHFFFHAKLSMSGRFLLSQPVKTLEF